MSKSVELLSGTNDSEAHDQSCANDKSRLNLNGKSKSATELRAKDVDIVRPKSSNEYQYSNHQSHIPYRHVASVAQRTHTFFSTLKSRWSRGRTKERKKSKETKGRDSPHKCGIIESDYATDYSSDQSKSSSTTYSPARIIFNHPESPLIRGNHDKLGSENLLRLSSANIPPNDDLHRTSVCGEDTVNDEAARHRELALRQHAFFQLHLHLRRGTNLVAMDRCGASDPYVKIKCAGRLLHKSRTVQRELNPVWDEIITLPIEVFDYDWGLQDDFMGAAPLDLTLLELGHAQDIVLSLKDPAKPRQNLGEIFLTVTLWPRNQQEKEQYLQRSNRLADVNKRLKSQIWSSVVTIVLIEAKNLLPTDIDGHPDPYVKFRLGTEKYKSKVVNKTLHPVWLEQFDLHLYEDPFSNQELEVTVWDRDKSHQDDIMGRTIIKLAHLEHEKTHRIWRDLADGAGNIFLLLTISGTTASETISDLAAHEEIPSELERISLRYCIWNTFQRPRDGLAVADLGGKSDPFCVLELVNSRLQTQTEYKTLSPNWQKIFTFNVKDINSVLEVTVFDEDKSNYNVFY
ncbi:hypothetical protein HCN44_007733 [Aphidius gifuensis]|uniref:C2 domain-containing protein n=1 Tax=Aphidius gifuensis TaxID=684658 RepID=A0A834XL46_APHGI|nr:hypothetical protein HCN44_007733 [Aphidius gifuensis]